MKKVFFVMTIIAALMMSCSEESTSPSYQLHAPTNLQLQQLDVMRFKLNWTDESSGEEGYKIERQLDSSNSTFIAKLPEDSDTYTDTLNDRNTYETVTYYIYSYYSTNESDRASISDTIDFPAPTNLSAQLDENDKVKLAWEDNSNGEEGFKIERKHADEFHYTGNVDANVTTFIDSNATAGYWNYYRVYAYANGNNTNYTDIDSIYIYDDELHAEFSANPTSGFAPLLVEFTDQSSGNVTNWQWDFQDDGIIDSYEQNPIFTYPTPGFYSVSLTVEDSTNIDNETKLNYITVNQESGNVLTDQFESYTDFSINFSPWTLVDLDGSETYGIQGVSWTNVYDPQAFIIFNPGATSPMLANAPAYSGNKYAACFSATTPPNNDWLITPEVDLTGEEDLMFMAKSYTADYGLERFEVGISTTNPAPGEFTIISAGSYEEAPADAWTEFSYGLQDYTGSVYIGIHCISNDAWFLMIDDIVVGNPHERGNETMKIDFESGNYLRSSK